jgi:hypothetical protein
MQIAVGANRLPKYWIKFLLFCNALHLSALGPQNLDDCGCSGGMQCENMYFVKIFVENVAIFHVEQ